MAGSLHIFLRAHRKARRFTQQTIADVLHVAHNTYSEKERGLRPVDLEELEKIANFYGIHAIALLLAPEDGPRADLIRRAAEIARTKTEDAAKDWLKSGEHLPPAEPGS